MIRRSIVMLAACGGGDPIAPPPTVAPSGSVAAIVGRAAPHAPHGGTIAHVAVTDDGLAAVTSDELGGVRLWAELDGSEEPRAIAVSAPLELAIAHLESDLLIVVRDEAGGLELDRVARDGAPHGRAKVSAEPGATQLAMIGDTVLALGRDQVVRWYDARGQLRGQLAPEPGTRIGELASRHGHAIVLDEPGTTLRTLELAPALHWGPAIALPIGLRDISLAPSHHRIAGIEVASGRGTVIDLSTRAVLGHVPVLEAPDEPASTGFVTDDEVMFATPHQSAWWGRDDGTEGVASDLAIGDHVALSGVHATLAFHVGEPRFLGYRELAANGAVNTAAPLALVFEDRLIWLDDQLHVTRSSRATSATPRFAFDDRHYIAVRAPLNAQVEPRAYVSLVDAVAGTDEPLGTAFTVGGMGYDPATRVLAVQLEQIDGQHLIVRTRFDAQGAMSKLPSLALATNASVMPLDPLAADGAIAVAITATELLTFRAPDQPPRHTEVKGVPIGVARDGSAMFFVAPRVLVYRDGRLVRDVLVDPSTRAVTPSHDGRVLAVLSPAAVTTVDESGRERWRAAVLEPSAALFGADDRTIAVTTPGGLVILDAETGRQPAAGCGWNFVMSGTEPVPGTVATPTVCE